MLDDKDDRLDLSAVHPKYHDLVRAIHKDPKAFLGRLVRLAPSEKKVVARRRRGERHG